MYYYRKPRFRENQYIFLIIKKVFKCDVRFQRAITDIVSSAL